MTTLVFFILAMSFQHYIALITEIDAKYLRYAILILALDALVIIPFARLRANEKPMRYAIIKILNVVINLGLNVFFLYLLPKRVLANPESIWAGIYKPDFEISYIFIANLAASAITLLMMYRHYFKITYKFDLDLWKRMMQYAMPVLVAGIAFTINEVFDRVLLGRLLPGGSSQQ